MYAHFPGLRVVVPSTPYDAKGLLHHALRCQDPVVFLEHRELFSLKGPVPEDAYEIPFGKAAVVRAGGEVYALRDVCSHAEVPLSEGEIYDRTVECWLHGSCFDLRTGQPTGPPATEPVPTYPVKIDGDDVYVSLDQET